MTRSLTTVLAAAALAGSLVATGPAAVAGPGAHGHGGAHDNAGHGSKPDKGDKQLAAARRAVATQVRTKDAALVRAVRTVTRAALAVGQDEVLANIDADRLALADLGAAAQAATTLADVKAVGEEVKAVRPEVYNVVVNGLRQAVRFQALAAAGVETLDALTAAADAAELEGHDVTAVRDAIDTAWFARDEADLQAAAALEQGVLLTAFSTTEEREAFRAAVAAAGAALDEVAAQVQVAEDALAALVPLEGEPVV